MICRWSRHAPPFTPAAQGVRLVGEAFTLRFVPAREDLATPESWSSPKSTRAAIEAMPEGAIVVADAMGVTDAGIFGDILCARLRKRGVTALVTDGAVHKHIRSIFAKLDLSPTDEVDRRVAAVLRFLRTAEQR